MRMYLLVFASPLMSICWCSASGTTLMIGAPGPPGSGSLASSRSILIRGIGMSLRLLFQGVCPVILSISPVIALKSWALNARSPNGFPLGLVSAGGVPPHPHPPLPLPGVLIPWHVVACNLHPLEWTLQYKIVEVIFPSEKATSSKFSPDRIRVNSNSILCSGVKGNSLNQLLWASILWWRISVHLLKLAIPSMLGISGIGDGGSGTSVRSRDNGSTGVMDPIGEDPLLGVWTIKFSSIL